MSRRQYLGVSCVFAGSWNVELQFACLGSFRLDCRIVKPVYN